jgi:hypothetical protein
MGQKFMIFDKIMAFFGTNLISEIASRKTFAPSPTLHSLGWLMTIIPIGSSQLWINV